MTNADSGSKVAEIGPTLRIIDLQNAQNDVGCLHIAVRYGMNLEPINCQDGHLDDVLDGLHGHRPLAFVMSVTGSQEIATLVVLHHEAGAAVLEKKRRGDEICRGASCPAACASPS